MKSTDKDEPYRSLEEISDEELFDHVESYLSSPPVHVDPTIPPIRDDEIAFVVFARVDGGALDGLDGHHHTRAKPTRFRQIDPLDHACIIDSGLRRRPAVGPGPAATRRGCGASKDRRRRGCYHSCGGSCLTTGTGSNRFPDNGYS